MKYKKVTECPYCGAYAMRVVYNVDEHTESAIYYCDECNGQFTVSQERKNKDNGKRWGFRM